MREMVDNAKERGGGIEAAGNDISRIMRQEVTQCAAAVQAVRRAQN